MPGHPEVGSERYLTTWCSFAMVKLEDELQKEAKIEAIRQNKSLTQYVSDLVKKELETKKEQTQKL